MAIKHIFAGALIGLVTVVSVPALADVKAGVDAWSAQQFDRAVAEWRPLAEAGDADAQFNLGQAYRLGKGVEQDLTRAELLYGRAAAQGHMQATDNYGVMLFDRGERAAALPYIRASADRGEPRAQYLLGIAHFNGELVPKDWVRAYALVSLARHGNIALASPALAQMDQQIPLPQRQQAVALASDLATQASANRVRQLAAADLGVMSRVSTARPAPGADFVRTSPRPAPTPVAATPPRPAATPAAATPAAAIGPWRVQLGAFGVAGNANALWNRVKNRPELTGHARVVLPAAKVTRLLAGGFATQASAQAACTRLSAGGVSCLVTRN